MVTAPTLLHTATETGELVLPAYMRLCALHDSPESGSRAHPARTGFAALRGFRAAQLESRTRAGIAGLARGLRRAAAMRWVILLSVVVLVACTSSNGNLGGGKSWGGGNEKNSGNTGGTGGNSGTVDASNGGGGTGSAMAWAEKNRAINKRNTSFINMCR